MPAISSSPVDFRRRAFSRGALFFWAILFRLILEFGYVSFVFHLFSYMGFDFSFSIQKYVESWILYLVLLLLMPVTFRRPSDILVAILFAGLIVPCAIIYSYSDKSRSHFYLIVATYFIVDVLRKGKPLSIPTIAGGQLAMLILLCGISCVVTVWYILSGGLNYFNLDLSKVYDFRRESGELTNVGVMGYVNNWAPKVAGPALLAFFLWKKRYLLVGLVVLLHVVWFGVSAHKSVLFYPILVFALWKWFESAKSMALFYSVLSVVTVLILLPYFAYENILWASMLMRRVFFVVAYLVFEYMEFFSDHQFIFWSNSILSWALKYPYVVSPAILIGEWQGTEAYANVSFIGAGYMHAGGLGVILYAILVGLIFRLIDSVAARGVPQWVAAAVVIVSGRSLLLGADLPTALLTHGVGLAILSLALMRDKRVVEIN